MDNQKDLLELVCNMFVVCKNNHVEYFTANHKNAIMILAFWGDIPCTEPAWFKLMELKDCIHDYHFSINGTSRICSKCNHIEERGL